MYEAVSENDFIDESLWYYHITPAESRGVEVWYRFIEYALDMDDDRPSGYACHGRGKF